MQRCQRQFEELKSCKYDEQAKMRLCVSMNDEPISTHCLVVSSVCIIDIFHCTEYVGEARDRFGVFIITILSSTGIELIHFDTGRSNREESSRRIW